MLPEMATREYLNNLIDLFYPRSKQTFIKKLDGVLALALQFFFHKLFHSILPNRPKFLKEVSVYLTSPLPLSCHTQG